MRSPVPPRRHRHAARAALLLAGLAAAIPAVAPRAMADEAPADPQRALAAQGKELYTQLCSHCHGVNMVNPGTSSYDLRRFPHDDHARFLNSVTHGKNSMPAWGDMLAPEEMEQIWAYILTGGKR